MNIGVFCSAQQNIDKSYFEKAAELGRWMASQGHTLVFGGGNIGLMGCIVEAVKTAGGHTIGVIPVQMHREGLLSRHVDVTILSNNLSDRKELITAKSDILVALPGGIGTLDEVLTVIAAHLTGFNTKHVILYNMDGFWASLIALLDDLQTKKTITTDWRRFIFVANSLEELQALLPKEA